MLKNRSVLIFDSGVGGLSIYQEIKALLPQLSCVYIFDNEAYPYGELSQDILVRRVDTYITSFIQSHKIDLVVIACCTASTVVLPTLRAKLTIPTVGVVPAIKTASLLSSKAVGLIATSATITRKYTKDLVSNFSKNKSVRMLGSRRLVEIAEEKIRGIKVDIYELAEILIPIQGHVDVVVLGCTHFSLIKAELQSVLGYSVLLVDSGKAVARRVKSLLNLENSQASGKKNQIYCSAPPWKGDVLNYVLDKLGFTPVQLRLIQSI
ncbi:glutamate racemase [Candidatus Photodesmus blepharus]|uniref:Glutamate racemase n=1 Tax=Candidatus Photodesmus blepharonis TaxID=1179155 RepID=A0A084CP88_9GAMM|nr:glutamate racemase [Candidatus Photodesmus blepharus]KEY91617.1 glutamate racemase [Candidatus Photodesmus blepharus]